MAGQPWLDAVRNALDRRALPPDYVERFVQELSDHLEDLTEENVSMESNLEARLGTPEQLAETANAEYRHRRLLEEHPWLALATFVLLPIPTLVVLWAATLASLVFVAQKSGVEDLLRSASGQFTSLGTTLVDSAVAVSLVVPLAALAVFFSLLARRTVRRRRWTLVACAILAVVGGLATHGVVLSATPGQSSLNVGLGFGPGVFGGWQMLQCLVPLGIGLVVSASRGATTAENDRSSSIA